MISLEREEGRQGGQEPKLRRAWFRSPLGPAPVGAPFLMHTQVSEAPVVGWAPAWQPACVGPPSCPSPSSLCQAKTEKTLGSQRWHK